MSRLDEIRGRLAAATPGPWVARTWACTEGGFAGIGPHHDTEDDAEDSRCIDDGCEPGCSHDVKAQADAALIANAPADLAWLLAEVERLGELLESLARHASHLPYCEALMVPSSERSATPCTCGYRDALAAVQEGRADG